MKTLADYEAAHPEWFEHSIGHDCPPGWSALILGILDYVENTLANRADLQTYADAGKEWAAKRLLEEPAPVFHVEQIKEKYGQLRFYLSTNIPGLWEASIVAMFASSRTCIECGRPGKLYTTGWYLSLCPEHAKANGTTEDGIACPEPSDECGPQIGTPGEPATNPTS